MSQNILLIFLVLLSFSTLIYGKLNDKNRSIEKEFLYIAYRINQPRDGEQSLYFPYEDDVNTSEEIFDLVNLIQNGFIDPRSRRDTQFLRFGRKR
jgi:hypothetical protein